MKHAWAAIALWLSATHIAHATPRAHLLYRRLAGADRCPSEAELRRAVTERLGYEPFSDDAPTQLSVMVQRVGDGLVARIDLWDSVAERGGARQLQSATNDCAELTSQLTLSISLAIDPMAPMAEVVPATPTAPPPSARTNAPAPTPPKPAAPRPAPTTPPLRIFGGVGALGTLGSAPAVAAGFDLLVGARRGTVSLALEARGDLPSGQNALDGQVHTALVTGTLAPCAHWRFLSGCGLLAVGASFGIGSGYSMASEVATPYVAAGLRAAAELPLGRFLALALHLDGLVPLVRTTLKVSDTAVFQPPPVQGALGARLLVFFR